MYHPTFEEFESRYIGTEGANIVPVYRQLLADVLTPVSVLEKVGAGGHSFLFESVVGGEKIARYSFVAANPEITFQARRNEITITGPGEQLDLDREGARLVRERFLDPVDQFLERQGGISL